MTLDADLYRINILNITNLTKDKSPKERLEMLGGLAVITGVPIIVLGYYLGEIYGLDLNLEAAIMKLRKFYAVTEVYNVKG